MAKKRHFETTALVLQGGGALGSYQAGVVEGLMQAGIEPDWVAGVSIGAINSALIAGNPPEQRLAALRGFWETISEPSLPMVPSDWLRQWATLGGAPWRKHWSGLEAWRTALEGQRGFFRPRGPQAWMDLPQPPGQVSYYDVSALKGTLERFVDFERLNHGPMRVSVGAVEVATGNHATFDTDCTRLTPEHIMASGALPPGFPAIEIDGHHYWDGGLVSNTPLADVLAHRPRRDTLVFQVDLWSAHGPLPRTVYDAQERMKDIQYSSRTRAITTAQREAQHHRRMLRELLELIPPGQLQRSGWCRRALEEASSKQVAVIHLIYRDKEWEGQAKDYEFSRMTMQDHWASGLADMQQALTHPQWLVPPASGAEFVTHDAAS